MSDDTLFTLNTRDDLLRIPIAKIVYIEGDGNYSHIVTPNKLRATITSNLSRTEAMLYNMFGEQAEVFMRVGKRFIINTQYIYRINTIRNEIVVTDFTHFAWTIPISRDAARKAKDILQSQNPQQP